jgi:hypothetical protein
MKRLHDYILRLSFIALFGLSACSQKKVTLLGDSAAGERPQDLSCAASPAIAVQNIPTNLQGVPIVSVDFSILVNSSSTAIIEDVKIAGVSLPSPDVQPDAPGMSHTVVVPVNTVGTIRLDFTINDSKRSAVCSTSVTTAGQVVAGPIISSFTASPSQLSLGASTDLSLAVQGATQLQIGNQNVPIINGAANLQVAPATSGTINYRAVATGPGGSSERSVSVNVAPACQLRAASTTGTVGSDLPFDVTINGSYATGKISGTGIQELNIATGLTSFRTTVRVIAATGRQEISMDLTAANGQTARCSDSVTLVNPPPPTCTLSAVNPTATVGDSITFNFTIQGVYRSGSIFGTGLESKNVANGAVTSGSAVVRVIDPAGPQTANLNVSYLPLGGLITCSTQVNLLPSPVAPTVNFTIDGSDVMGRQFYEGQLLHFEWSSSGADSCSFVSALDSALPNTLSGSLDVRMNRTAQTIVLTCVKNTPSGGQIPTNKRIGFGVTIPLCFLGEPMGSSVIGSTFRLRGSTTGAHRGVVVTGANVATFSKGAGSSSPFDIALTVTSNTPNRTLTMTVDYARGVSNTCTTALGP